MAGQSRDLLDGHAVRGHEGDELWRGSLGAQPVPRPAAWVNLPNSRRTFAYDNAERPDTRSELLVIGRLELLTPRLS